MNTDRPTSARYAAPGDGLHFHPLFSEDGDICLASNDGKLHFRTHSAVLRKSSGFWKDSFSLHARGLGATEDGGSVIHTPFSAIVLDHLMRMASGMELLPLSIDVVRPLIDAAEDWMMPGPLSIIRLAIQSPPLVDHVLEMYVICRRQGWEEELKVFATKSLKYNLYDPAHYDTLKNLSGSALLDLLLLHRGRRELLRDRLNNPPFVSGGAATCAQCQGRIEYSTWRELKYRIILEMDANPSGEGIAKGLNDWNEAQACWLALCPTANCQRRLYDKIESCKAILEVVGSLPTMVGADFSVQC